MVDFARPTHLLHTGGDPAIPGARITPVPSGGQGLALNEKGLLPSEITDEKIRGVLRASQHVTSFTSTDTNYTGISSTNIARPTIYNALDIYRSGLRPQMAINGLLDNSGANTTSARPAIYEVADGDTAVNQLAGGPEIAHVGTTATYKLATWTDVSLQGVTLTDPHWQLILEVKTSAGTATYIDMGFSFRWA